MPPMPAIRSGPVSGGQVVEAIAGYPGPLNPLFEQDENAKDIDSLIYQGLTTVDPNQQVVGLLAKAWTISDDKLSYTVDLRQGVRWADGRPFNADDVMFTYGVLNSPDYTEPTDQDWKNVKIEKLGNLQVRFTLKAPSASFPLALRQGIVARHLFGNSIVPKMQSSDYSQGQAMGTGPFKVGSISPDRHTVTLDRNPYANPKPYLDHFVFRGFPSPADALDAVSSGQADLVGELALPPISALSKRSDLTMISVRTFDFTGVYFNRTPDSAVYFNQPTVRQALVQAVDRRRVVQDVLGGRADAAPGPIPPTDWAYSKADADKLAFDPTQAAKTLQAAGWAMNMQTGILNQAGRDFSVSLATTDAPPYRQVADSVAAQLRLVGVQVQVSPVPTSELVSKVLVGSQYQLALVTFDNGPDPDQYTLWDSEASAASLNFSRVDRLPHQALIDKALQDGRTETDPGQRRPRYADFQNLMADAAPAIFLFEPHYTYIVSKRVRGLHTNPVIDPVDRFEYVADWYVATLGG
jgi:peptide/nickel transport system substrate-binding protein